MTRRCRNWNLAGVRIHVHAGWMAALALLTWCAAIYFREQGPDLSQVGYWVWGTSAALVFFLSIVFHETGHALAARLAGMRVSGISLFLFGGVVEFGEPPPSPGAEAMVAAAGPAVSGILASVSWLLLSLAGWMGWNADLIILWKFAAWMNSGVLIFNLLPALPLDGGCILHAVFWHLAGDPRRATRWSVHAGNVVAGALLAASAASLFAGYTGLAICLCLGSIWLGPGEMLMKSSAEQAYENLPAQQALTSK
jgi:Zn-dependent protease